VVQISVATHFLLREISERRIVLAILFSIDQRKDLEK